MAFARVNGINAQDGDALLGLIATRTPEQQVALLATAFEGEWGNWGQMKIGNWGQIKI
ncbi:hypothetical protein [Ottowia beijingensis]|uniref:hypothetical protein n=1 Tax=Ottowia beijingensis TaxID=1207057 RepID=UPI002FDA4F04